MKTLLFLAAASLLTAQAPPSVSNAQLETRAFSGDLETQLRSSRPAWFGYQIKTVHKDDGCCLSDSNRGCYLEDDNGQRISIHSNRPVQLEGTDQAAVLYRVADNKIDKVHVFSMACPLDAGGLPFIWLTGVSTHASLTELRKLAPQPNDGAIFAIAQHEGTEADDILAQLSASGQSEHLREKVSFWLGSSRGKPGVKILQQVLKNDPSTNIRDKAVFALSVSPEPEALPALIKEANSAPSPHVRSQAIFWLGQKAGKLASSTIVNAINNDPDTEVKKKAVFALSQLPKDDGVPKLIEVARTQRDPEVRKQAFFWLGQTGDPRALAFIEQVLEK